MAQMKRSEINALIRGAKMLFKKHSFLLPPWAHWSPDQWRGKRARSSEVVNNMLGWDVTDFGSGDYHRCGLLLFTIRNGNQKLDKKTYAEKVLVVGENQETPMHYHLSKMEDIINRGGGQLAMQLYNSTPDNGLADTDVHVKMDGFDVVLPAGSTIVLEPGESVTLPQRLFHRFYGQPQKGEVLVGEVSTVNDDSVDNIWHEPHGRFPSVLEDEPPLHLLASDYANLMPSE